MVIGLFAIGLSFMAAAAAALLVTLPFWGQRYEMGYGQLSLLCLAIVLVYSVALVGLGFDPTSRLAWKELRARLVSHPSKAVTSSFEGESL